MDNDNEQIQGKRSNSQAVRGKFGPRSNATGTQSSLVEDKLGRVGKNVLPMNQNLEAL